MSETLCLVDDGDGGLDHEWEWREYWYGAEDVVGGLACSSQWVCKTCGVVGDMPPPGDDYDD